MEQVLATTSTLDLKVWTRLEENESLKEKKKIWGANPSQSSFTNRVSQRRAFGYPDLLPFWILPTRRLKLACLVQFSALNMLARALSVPER